MDLLLEKDLLDLARRLPLKDDSKNLERIRHANNNGHLVILRVGRDILGYAEVYRVKEIPNYPVIPYPKDDVDGNILYCFSAVCERGFIKDLIKLGFDSFLTVDSIVYHRRKHGNRVYKIMRDKNV